MCVLLLLSYVHTLCSSFHGVWFGIDSFTEVLFRSDRECHVFIAFITNITVFM